MGVHRSGHPFGSAFDRTGDLYFLSRHGRGHKLPPPQINYRANIWALREVGVQAAIATFAVGASDRVCQWVRLWCWTIFWTSRLHGRKLFDDKSAAYRHDPAVQPPGAGRAFGSRRGFRNNAGSRGCYVCTDGPRYETLSEVRMFAALGGDVVG